MTRLTIKHSRIIAIADQHARLEKVQPYRQQLLNLCDLAASRKNHHRVTGFDDRVTAGNQALGAMHADETGSPCQKNFHVVAFKTACRLVPPTDSTNRWCCLYSRTADWHKTDKSEATIRLGTTMKGNHRDIAPDLD